MVSRGGSKLRYAVWTLVVGVVFYWQAGKVTVHHLWRGHRGPLLISWISISVSCTLILSEQLSGTGCWLKDWLEGGNWWLPGTWSLPGWTHRPLLSMVAKTCKVFALICAQPGCSARGCLLPPQRMRRYYGAAEIVNWKNYMEMMPSLSPTLLKQVFANPWVGGVELNKAVAQCTLAPMCSCFCAQHGSCSRSAETPETRAGAHVVYPALLSFCSSFGISGREKSFGWYCCCGQ